MKLIQVTESVSTTHSYIGLTYMRSNRRADKSDGVTIGRTDRRMNGKTTYKLIEYHTPHTKIRIHADGQTDGQTHKQTIYELADRQNDKT